MLKFFVKNRCKMFKVWNVGYFVLCLWSSRSDCCC